MPETPDGGWRLDDTVPDLYSEPGKPIREHFETEADYQRALDAWNRAQGAPPEIPPDQ